MLGFTQQPATVRTRRARAKNDHDLSSETGKEDCLSP